MWLQRYVKPTKAGRLVYVSGAHNTSLGLDKHGNPVLPGDTRQGGGTLAWSGPETRPHTPRVCPSRVA